MKKIIILSQTNREELEALIKSTLGKEPLFKIEVAKSKPRLKELKCSIDSPLIIVDGREFGPMDAVVRDVRKMCPHVPILLVATQEKLESANTAKADHVVTAEEMKTSLPEKVKSILKIS